MSCLTPQAVEVLFGACHEPLGTAGGDVVEVDTVAGPTWLKNAAVREHRDEIAWLLAELPDEFMASKGGGWSFLNACIDRHGDPWTGMQMTVAKLFALGEAAGLVVCQMPREMWDVLPGGMPYYVVADSELPQNYEEPF